MKQKDVLLVAAIAIVAAVLSAVLSNLIFAPASKKTTAVEIVDAISSDFPLPDTRYFNENSINPTKVIVIGENPEDGNPFPELPGQ